MGVFPINAIVRGLHSRTIESSTTTVKQKGKNALKKNHGQLRIIFGNPFRIKTENIRNLYDRIQTKVVLVLTLYMNAIRNVNAKKENTKRRIRVRII